MTGRAAEVSDSIQHRWRLRKVRRRLVSAGLWCRFSGAGTLITTEFHTLREATALVADFQMDNWGWTINLPDPHRGGPGNGARPR